MSNEPAIFGTQDTVAALPQSGGARALLKSAILSLSLLLCSVSVTMAVVSSLKQDFPNASTMELQSFVNVPVIAGIMTFDWHYFYFVYFFALLVFFFVLVFVPNSVNEIGKVHKSEQAGAAKPKRTKMPFGAYFGMILQIVFATGYGFYTVNLSLAAEETGVITAVQAATVMTVVSISSFIGGFLFGFAKRFAGMFIGIIAIAMEAAGLFLWANTASLGAWYAAAVLFGVGFCWFMPYVNFLVNEHTDPTISAQATSYAFFGNSVGSFLPTYAFAALGALTGLTSTWKSLNEAGVMMIICIVMVLVFNAFDKKKLAAVEAEPAK